MTLGDVNKVQGEGEDTSKNVRGFADKTEARLAPGSVQFYKTER